MCGILPTLAVQHVYSSLTGVGQGNTTVLAGRLLGSQHREILKRDFTSIYKCCLCVLGHHKGVYMPFVLYNNRLQQM